jgi:hypothetical protein
VRVCILRKKLKSAIKIPSAAWNAIEHMADDYRFYGTCIESSGRGVFKIQFDQLPCDHNEINIPRKDYTTLAKDNDEPEYSHQADQEEEETEEQGNFPANSEDESEDDDSNNVNNPTTKNTPPGQGQKKKVNHLKQWQEVFLKLPLPSCKSAKSFQHKYGPGETDFVVWTILDDDELIVEDAMDHPQKNCLPLKVNLPWNVHEEKIPFNDHFFQGFFPSLQGKAKLMDEFFSDPRCGMEATIKK